MERGRTNQGNKHAGGFRNRQAIRKDLRIHEDTKPHPYEDEILSAARELNITAYDASYIVLAKKNGLTLVTEDKKLRTKAEKIVKVVSLTQITS